MSHLYAMPSLCQDGLAHGRYRGQLLNSQMRSFSGRSFSIYHVLCICWQLRI